MGNAQPKVCAAGMARTLGSDAYNLHGKLLSYGSFLSHKIAFEVGAFQSVWNIPQSSNVSISSLLSSPVTLCS